MNAWLCKYCRERSDKEQQHTQQTLLFPFKAYDDKIGTFLAMEVQGSPRSKDGT